MDKFAIDTNLLIYALDRRDAPKHAAARTLLKALAARDTVLPLHSLAEFFHVARRKGDLSVTEAAQRVEELQAVFPVVLASAQTLRHAIAGVRDHQLSFWDAMLWATTQEAGVTVLFTENSHDDAVIEGVRFVNPFKHANLREILE